MCECRRTKWAINVANLVAVVRSAEYCNAAAVVHDFKAFLLHLVAAHKQLKAIALQECFCHIRPERDPHAPATVVQQ